MLTPIRRGRINTKQDNQSDFKRVERLIRRISKYGDLGLVFTNHIRESMNKRDFTTSDILKVLSTGELKKKREFDDMYQNWKYRIEGKDVEGEKLTLIFSITQEEDAIILITGC